MLKGLFGRLLLLRTRMPVQISPMSALNCFMAYGLAHQDYMNVLLLAPPPLALAKFPHTCILFFLEEDDNHQI
jgi:hypothetical protein